MPRLQCSACGEKGRFSCLARLHGGREIWRCHHCGLVFAHPMPSGQEIADYYQGFAFGMPGLEAVIAHQKLIATDVVRIVEDLVAVDCHFGSILDFGGGLGYYANAFADHFETVDMFDLDRVALEHARTLFPACFGLHTTEPGKVPQFDRKYDVVFANQVIEHYTDLDLFFATLHAAAHEDTVFVITTPNNRSANLWVRPDMLAHYSGIGSRNAVDRLRNVVSLARDSWACCDPPRHVFAFDPDNLRLVAARHSLEALRVSSIYCTENYYSPAKYQSVPIRSARTLVRHVINAPIRGVIRLLRKFDSAAQRGDDIVFVAKVVR